jgi:predicted metal-dependent hydrolase
MMQNQLLILNDGQQIPYLLEHRPRRTVGLKITEQGLIVHAPKRIFAAQLNKILQEKSGWIINKLQLRDENKVEKVEWIDGAQLLFLGQDITLKLVANIGANKTKKIHFERNELVVHALGANIHAACRASVLMWYKNQAQLDFARRLEVFAAKLGIATPPLTLSNAKSRWGSCNSRKEIRLNWRHHQLRYLPRAGAHQTNEPFCQILGGGCQPFSRLQRRRKAAKNLIATIASLVILYLYPIVNSC